MPTVHVIGGPNGAGKTTLAFRLIPRLTSGVEFVNADLIAQGLSAFEPEKVALAAGRIMLKRLDELANARADFAFECTLAARSFAPMLTRLKVSGYHVVVFYVWQRNADNTIQRVAERVRRGGHFVPPETVRRRFGRSWANALDLYLPLADDWTVIDNTASPPAAVAERHAPEEIVVHDLPAWQDFQRGPILDL